MDKGPAAELSVLRKMATGELRERYARLFGEPAKSHNRDHLFKKCAYRLQELAYGPLSERAKAQAATLADEAAIRTNAPMQRRPKTPATARDPRLPAIGSVLTKEHRGRTYKVLVADDGFEFEGARYRSLSAIARKITGTAWNGFLFFGNARVAKKPEEAV
ncbi:DUF2924 domain-containing protein [bacterium]|nr:DUF2924 domain-containing protein [bacterium]